MDDQRKNDFSKEFFESNLPPENHIFSRPAVLSNEQNVHQTLKRPIHNKGYDLIV